MKISILGENTRKAKDMLEENGVHKLEPLFSIKIKNLFDPISTSFVLYSREYSRYTVPFKPKPQKKYLGTSHIKKNFHRSK
jgi:hypothetical protein